MENNKKMKSNATMAMHEIHERLVGIKAALEKLRFVPNAPNQLTGLQEQLRTIDSKRIEGKFMFNGEIPPGQADLVLLLEECYGLAYEIRTGMRFMEQELKEIKAALMVIELSPHPTYVQLASYQDRLNHVAAKVASDGAYHTESGEIPKGQADLFELLNLCFALKNQIVLRIEGKVGYQPTRSDFLTN